ncbi:MAG: prolipoprotein diacylglyceryl transferase [Bacillota bacterium]|nr:prolipoprotein diacylglyceryl transferase [Bacillota bacterium]
MNPVAFTIFGLPVMWYGILITSGMVLGFLVIKSLIDEKHNLTKDQFLDFFLILIPVSVLTTRLYYVIFYDLEYYLSNPAQILNFRQGGLAIHGGIIGGLLTTIIYTKKKNINLFYLLDLLAPGLALGQSIGRWGNFINQEAHGGPTDLPWGIMVDGVKVHPTFLYESIVTFSLFVFLYFFFKKRKFNGQSFAIYSIVYSIARFFIEGLRTDSLYLGPLKVAQLVSILGIVLGLIIIFTQQNKKASKA